jgi:NitT/TauT family transport system substrate-binding protein
MACASGAPAAPTTAGAPATSARAEVPPPATAAAPAPTAGALVPPVDLKVGTPLTIGETPLYLAIEKGYLREQGLNVETVLLSTAEQMIPPLSAGQIDVGVGGLGPGLFNAVARDIKLRLVSFGAIHAPGRSSWLVARKDLVDSGQLKDYADLKGKTLATPGGITVTHFFFDRARIRGGLAPDDLQYSALSFPDMVVALANGNIDVAFLPEPFASQAVENEIGVRWKPISDVAPNFPAVIWMYSQNLIDTQPEAARRFMVALLKGSRDYEDAIANNRGRPEAVAAAIKHTQIKDPALYDKMVFTQVPTSGEIDKQTLEEVAAWFRSQGAITEMPDLNKVVDTDFTTYAAQQLRSSSP